MAGTSTATLPPTGGIGSIRRVQIAFTGDAANGGVPACVLPGFNGQILAVDKIDGDPAPTNGWTVALADADGRAYDPTGQAGSKYAMTDKPITATIAGNIVHSAKGTVRIMYVPQPVS